MPFVKDLDLSLRAYRPAYEIAGHITPEAITATNISQVRRTLGLEWEPATEPQYRVKTRDGMDAFEQVPGAKYITRGDGGPILGSVKDGYNVFENGELFEIAEAVGIVAVEQGYDVRCLAGGELFAGRKVYLLFDLGVVEIPGDPSPHARFMTLLTSHGGSGAVKAFAGDHRWHCTNALKLAEMDAAADGAAYSFRHTTHMRRRIEASKKAILATMLQQNKIAERTRELTRKRITKARASDYLEQFALAMVVAKADPTREALASSSTRRATAVAAVHSGLRAAFDSPTCDGIRGSAYGPFAAAIEYLDHIRPAASADTFFDRTMVATERGKKTAYDLIGKTLI